MKNVVIKAVLVSLIYLNIACTKENEQEEPELSGFEWTQTGFTEKGALTSGGWMYRPRLKILDDALYVNHHKGIFRKNLNEKNDKWELFALGDLGLPIIDFVKNGDKILAITNTKNFQDSLVFLSVDNGKTFANFTSPDLFKDHPFDCHIVNGGTIAYQIAQHPQNANTVLLLHHWGVSISEDFGSSWRKILDRIPYGQNWYVGFHPLDGNTMFHSGEDMSFSGFIYRSADGGNSWSGYSTFEDYGDNCVHSIAFHPANPNILVYSGEGVIGKSTDKGETWKLINLVETEMYFFKVLFDEDNPTILYATGGGGGKSLYGEFFTLYRSTDMGETWHQVFEKNTKVEWGGSIHEMIKYKNKLYLYSWGLGIIELEIFEIH